MAMQDPEDLFELDVDLPDLTGTVLLTSLDGFVDAGAATATARAHLLDTLTARVIATFSVDELFDYRARRPVMRFARDHWESYDAPRLVVHLLEDADAAPFLLLSGPEPDVQWERFAEAVRLLVERLGVRLTVGMDAFPMGVPHTRPSRVILHGSRPELIAGADPFLGELLVPASAGHLLEFRLGHAGHDAMAVAIPVPAYVAQSTYPAAAAALLREVGTRTGLTLPVDALDEAAAINRVSIDEQVAKSDEIQALVRALEDQYDSFSRGEGQSLLAGEGGTLPSADELGAELERFLADQAGGGEHQG